MAKRRLVRSGNSVTDKWLEGTRKERKERTRMSFFVRVSLDASCESNRYAGSYSKWKTRRSKRTKEKIKESGGHRSVCGSCRALTPGPLESFIVVNQLLNITALYSALPPISPNLAPLRNTIFIPQRTFVGRSTSDSIDVRRPSPSRQPPA